VLGSLGGLLGSWLGVWLPSQLAPTRPESSYLRRHGKRVLLALALFTGLLAAPVWAFVAGHISLTTYLLLLGTWLAALWGYLAVEIVLMVRGLRRLRASVATAEPNDAPLRVAFETLASRYRGRVFRSQLSFLGLPLVDVQVGDPAEAGKPAARRAARGWIAVGDEAYGVLFALGGRSCGLVAIGGVAVGLVAVGGVALGGIALGGVAVGGIVGGGLGLGWQACGGLALGWDLACGAAAVAQHAAEGAAAVAHDYAVGVAAWATHVNDGAATAAISGQPMSAAIRWSMANGAWLAPMTVAAVLLGCGAALLLMYRRESGH
jgi:hypothetical protein